LGSAGYENDHPTEAGFPIQYPWVHRARYPVSSTNSKITALTNTSVGVSYTGNWMQNVETTEDVSETHEAQPEI
jgi:hypothetical protein